MRIAYCASVRLPSERAHGHQIAQVCDALVRLGHDVILFAPRRRNLIREDYWTYYGAERGVHPQYLEAFDNNQFPVPLGLPGLYLANASMRHALARALDGKCFDLLYTRTPVLLPVLLGRDVPVVLELHQLPRFGRKTFVQQCNACSVVSCLTSPMRDTLVVWGVDESKLIVEPDAVDLDLFAQQGDGGAWREAHSIPLDVPLVSYAGQLQSMGLSKGVEVLVAALDELARKGQNFQAVIAGGPDAEARRMGAMLPSSLRSKVRFLGNIPHREVPSLLRTSDVLVYPAPASQHPYYLRDTSPLKLFEYMAAERPIVCADLPPLHDIVSEQDVLFVPPGNAKKLVQAMANVIADPEGALKRVEHARQLVKRHTWKKRMERILSRVKT